MFRRVTAAVLLPVLIISGCASLPKNVTHQLPPNIPASHQIAGVPFIQQDDFQCGPATLAMALGYHEAPASVDELTSMVFSPDRKGTLQPFMIGAVRRLGLIGIEIDSLSALLSELAANNPVIILQNNGLSLFPRWHYALATGYDINQQTITLHSGSIPDYQLELHRFYQTWQRSKFWGLVITPPNKVPVTAPPGQLFLASAAIDQLGFHDQAAMTYFSILEKFPDHLDTRLALANYHYGKRDLTTARQALEKAVSTHPNSAVAHNNLAQVLLEQNVLAKAQHHAQIAVDLGGPFIDTANQTLLQINQMIKRNKTDE